MSELNLEPAASGPPTPAVKTATTNRAARWITPVLTAVAVAAIALFGGILIGHNTASSSASAAGQGGVGGAAGAHAGGGGAGPGGARTSGTITKVDANTITLKLTNGSTVTVTTAAATTVTTSSHAKLSDLAAGETIAVQGTKDSSGNVTATSVSEGALTGGFGGGRPAASATNG